MPDWDWRSAPRIRRSGSVRSGGRRWPGRARWSIKHWPAAASTGCRSGDGRTPSLRWILVRMIEEYARHNGHTDLIRESIDGLTGE
jgi:hypothetical protein